MRKVAGDYFELIEKLSRGTLYPIEQEMNQLIAKTDYDKVLDAFLKAYYDYMNNPTEEGRLHVLAQVAHIKKLNNDFNFDERKLRKYIS